MGIGLEGLTNDYLVFPRVRFSEALIVSINEEVRRLGPNFTLAMFGRQALRYANSHGEILDKDPLPANGPALNMLGPRWLWDESKAKSIRKFGRSGSIQRRAYGDYFRAACAAFLHVTKELPARSYTKRRILCACKVDGVLGERILQHVRQAGEPNLAYFMTESVFDALENRYSLPESLVGQFGYSICRVSMPVNICARIERSEEDPEDFVRRAVVARLALFGAA